MPYCPSMNCELKVFAYIKLFHRTCTMTQWRDSLHKQQTLWQECVLPWAPMVAMWADQFSRFWRFLACPLTLLPVSASCCLSPLLQGHHCCLATARGGGGGTWVNMGHAKRLILQQLDYHWGEELTESRPRLLLVCVVPLWVLVMLWSQLITYEIRISRQFSPNLARLAKRSEP